MKKGLLYCFLFITISAFSQNADQWRVKSVRHAGNLDSLALTDGVFTISVKEKKFSGRVGCNSFKGKLQTDHVSIFKPVNVVTTKAKCPEELSPEEYSVLEAINNTDEMLIRDTVAEFYSAGKIVLKLVRH